VAADYSTREVADLLGLSVAEVRRCARAGILSATAPGRFTFQDLVTLRKAAQLVSARVKPHRVRQALASLRDQLAPGQPLSAVQLSAAGGSVLAHEGGEAWNPLSGQLHLDIGEPAAEPRAAATSRPADARAEARIHLGSLLHEAGRLEDAEKQYRQVLARGPHPLASFNLAVVLEDLGRVEEAVAAYQATVAADPAAEDAYFNLARLYGRRGERAAALRALKTYRALTNRRR
jgi:tetratricopeptide (TPR) repeat protein